jgi:putative tryptophan/tyrosine transport system substrate-binding protein
MSMGLAGLALGFTLLLVSASFLAPIDARAQQEGKVYRIGFLRAGRPPETFVAGLQQGLRERGYVVGQNVVIEQRLTEGRFDQLPGLAEELVRLNVNVIVASAGPAAVAARKVTKSMPIVFVGVNGPVEIGLVSSLERPSANITGLALTAADLGGNA